MLEEKKKDVEEFYKSDSEDDDPDDEEWKPENETKSRETSPAEVVEGKDEVQENKAEEEQSKAVAEDIDELPDISVANLVTEGKDASVLERTQANSESKDDASTETNMETCTEPRTENINEMPKDTSDSMCVDLSGGEVDRDACQGMENKNNDSGVHSGESSPTKVSQIKAPESSLTTEVGSREEPLEDMEVCEKSVKVNDPLVRTEEKNESSMEIDNQPNTSTSNHMNNAKNSGTPKFSLLASRLPGLDVSKLLQTTPKLSQGGEEDFIDLEEEEECRTPHNASGVIDLMDRFVRHSSTKRKPSEKQKVNLK